MMLGSLLVQSFLKGLKTTINELFLVLFSRCQPKLVIVFHSDVRPLACLIIDHNFVLGLFLVRNIGSFLRLLSLPNEIEIELVAARVVVILRVETHKIFVLLLFFPFFELILSRALLFSDFLIFHDFLLNVSEFFLNGSVSYPIYMVSFIKGKGSFQYLILILL